jgi:hypothetical protein
MLVDRLRDSLYRVITTPRGDAFAPLRIQKDLARRLNMTLGSPLCSREEGEKRREAAVRLDRLRHGSPGDTASKSDRVREAAPVMVYFEIDRNVRELGRVEELLAAKGIAFTKLDVRGDEVTLDFVMREAKCKDDELPIVFVAGTAIGGFTALVAADVSGELERRVYGSPAVQGSPAER